MIIETSRFGSLDVEEGGLIHMVGGLVGFADLDAFAWVPHKNSQQLAWLQSATHPSVAFPILNAARFLEDGYPDVPVEQIAELGGVPFENANDLALMVVLSASEMAPPTVNLMAPIVINIETRKGAQVVLVNTRFSTVLLAPKATSRPVATASVEGP